MSGSKLIAIGIDAADATLVRRWANEGHLPTLSRLLQSGVVASVATPVGVLEGAIWPTLLTSLSAATHGMFTYSKINPGTYELEDSLSADHLPTPFWTELSRAGKHVAIIDAPFARPAKLNGIQLTNWGAHDPWCWERSSWPKKLLTEIVARFGDHPVITCDGKNRSPSEYEDLRSKLIRGVQQKTEIIRHCLNKKDWDLFFAVYSESHCIGHNFWHLMDSDHPRHDPHASASLQSAIRDVYAAIDEGLGAILSDAGPNANVMIVLSHGMGAYYHGSHLLEKVIDRLGINDRVNPGWSSLTDEAAANYSRWWHKVWNLGRLLPATLRNQLKQQVPDLLSSAWLRTHPEPHPWSTKRVFQLPDSNMTALLRINLKGREPAGLVAPGKECDELCRELKDALLALENPDTGRKAVQWVARVEEFYQGPRVNELPDLFVEWDHSAPIKKLSSPRIGTVQGEPQTDRTGSHIANGLLIGLGSEFIPGEAQEFRTVDIAPTILDFFGVRAPESYEGKSCLALLQQPKPRAA